MPCMGGCRLSKNIVSRSWAVVTTPPISQISCSRNVHVLFPNLSRRSAFFVVVLYSLETSG
jgi:hypothetical protein